MTGRWQACMAAVALAAATLGCGDSTVRRGDAAMDQQDFDTAIEAYRAALAQDPSNVDTRYRLVNAYVKRINVTRSLGPLPLLDLERAVAEVHEIIAPVKDTEPDLLTALVNLHFSLARNYDEARMPERAREEWGVIADLQPTAAARFNMGNAGMLLGDWEGAIASFRGALELDEFYIDAYKGIGNAAIQLGQDAEAVDAYRKALEIEPLDTPARYNLGVALKRINAIDEAIAEFQKVIDNDPSYALAYRGMRDAFEKGGDVEAALEWDRRFREVAGIDAEVASPDAGAAAAAAAGTGEAPSEPSEGTSEGTEVEPS